jgi:hypothetical protein
MLLSNMQKKEEEEACRFFKWWTNQYVEGLPELLKKAKGMENENYSYMARVQELENENDKYLVRVKQLENEAE